VRVIPARNDRSKPYGEAVGTNYRNVKGWTQSKDSDHDYGVIILPTALGNTVGWMGLAALAFASLMGLNVNNSGCPGDKPSGTQWWNSNNILAVTGRRLYDRIDAMGSQSGSPIWRFKHGNRHIVGIHTT
jgi:V8-like Glu-specific endopeptidase